MGFAKPVAKVRLMRTMAENTCITSDIDLDNFIGTQQASESSFGDQIGEVFDIDFDFGI